MGEWLDYSLGHLIWGMQHEGLVSAPWTVVNSLQEASECITSEISAIQPITAVGKARYMYMYMYHGFELSQLSCPGSSVGRVLA